MRKSEALLIFTSKTLDETDPAEQRTNWAAITALGEIVMAATVHSDEFELAETLTLIAKDGLDGLQRAEAAQRKFAALFINPQSEIRNPQ